MKSYGRAPTFLMATGYEQVRSVVAALTGDFVAADRTELSLPQTGVFISDPIIRAANNTPQSDHARSGNPQFTEGMS